MYSFKEIDNVWYVIHNYSGCSLPYHSKAKHYTYIPHYKRPFFSEWVSYSNAERKRLKQMNGSVYTKVSPYITGTQASMMIVDDFTITDVVSLAPLPCSPCDQPVCSQTKKKGKKAMYNDYDDDLSVRVTSDEQTKRDYLRGRIAVVNDEQWLAMRKLFKMDTPRTPDTAEDLVTRIKEGKYTLDEKNAKKNDYYYNGTSYISWRIPGEEADEDGFDAAMKQKDVILQKARDAAALKSIDEATKALEAFQTWVPDTTTTKQ